MTYAPNFLLLTVAMPRKQEPLDTRLPDGILTIRLRPDSLGIRFLRRQEQHLEMYAEQTVQTARRKKMKDDRLIDQFDSLYNDVGGEGG